MGKHENDHAGSQQGLVDRKPLRAGAKGLDEEVVNARLVRNRAVGAG